jgi:hypothetical protein
MLWERKGFESDSVRSLIVALLQSVQSRRGRWSDIIMSFVEAKLESMRVTESLTLKAQKNPWIIFRDFSVPWLVWVFPLGLCNKRSIIFSYEASF